MPNAQRRIEDKLPTEKLKWPIPEAEKEGCEVSTHAALYNFLLGKVKSLGYPSINAALDACAPFVSRPEPDAPQVPHGHWLPQRDPADEAVKLSKVLRQYPQLAEVMGREPLLMRCVREALCVEADPEVAHALRYAFVREMLADAAPVGAIMPLEATQEMIQAACDEVGYLSENRWARGYRAMIAAAPAEQAGKQVPTIVREAVEAAFECREGWRVRIAQAVRALNSIDSPAEGKRILSIDTPEFGELLARHALVADASGGTEQEWKEARAALIAHIDAQLAGQPAAPVAATEQAIPEGWVLVPAYPDQFMINAFITEYERRGGSESGCYRAMLAAAPKPPLATPADAGAGLTDERINDILRELRATAAENEDPVTAIDVARAIEREVLARLSTPAAPVTANKQQEIDRIAAYWKDQARRGCVDAFECALREAWDVARQSPAPVTAEPVAIYQVWNMGSGGWDDATEREYGKAAPDARRKLYHTPVSPQPAAQVPSLDDVLEEAAKVAEAHVYGPAGEYDSSYGDAEAKADDRADHIADAIRALKDQLAAAHAAHDQKGGE